MAQTRMTCSVGASVARSGRGGSCRCAAGRQRDRHPRRHADRRHRPRAGAWHHRRHRRQSDHRRRHNRASAGRRARDRRHRQVPDAGHDRRAYPPARRPRRQPAARRAGARGGSRAARLPLLRRDHSLRCRQPAQISSWACARRSRAARSSALVSSRPAAPWRARTATAGRTTSRPGPPTESCSTSIWPPSRTWPRSARTSTAGARGRRSISCPRICSRRSSATTTARACG